MSKHTPSMSDLLEAPCLFCGYNGQGYWKRGTHHEQCPWHMIGGEIERNEKLPELTRKLFGRVTPKPKGLSDE